MRCSKLDVEEALLDSNEGPDGGGDGVNEERDGLKWSLCSYTWEMMWVASPRHSFKISSSVNYA